MKLHLPKLLAAALLAACTAFALNTTAAAATGTATFSGDSSYNRGTEILDGLYLTKTMTTGTATSNALTLDNAVNIYGDNFYAKDYTVSIWVTRASLDSNQLLFAYGANNPTASISANGIYWNAQDQTITIGRGNVANDYTSMNWNSSDYKTSSSLASYLGDGDMVNFTIAVSGGNQSQIPTVWVNGESQWTAGEKYAGNMNNSANPMKLYVSTEPTYGNITVTDAKLTDATSIYALMGVSTTEPAAAVDYVWKGTESAVWDTTTENWVTKEATSTPTTFVASADNTVTFDSTGSEKEVSLAADTTIGTVTVDGAEYALNLGGHTLTTGTLAVENTGASLALTGEGTVKADTITASGKTINIGEKVVLTGGGSGTLAGKGTYVLNSGDTSLGGVTLDEGWTGVVRITDASLNNINLSGMRNAQSTVELKGFNGWTDPWEGTNGYNFKLTNGSNGYAWQNGAFGQNYATHIMEFTGVWSGDGLFLETGNTATRNMHYTYSGNIAAWTGEFRHNAKQDTNLTFKGSATNVNIAISKGASSTGVFNVVAGTTGVTFNKSVTADKLTVQEGATATFNGTATFGSVTEAASAGITVGTTGNLTLNGGSLTAAITNNGTLTFGGDITATGLTVTKGTSGLVDVNGATNTGNGFETTSGDSITIANNAATATLTPNGHKVTQDSVEYTIQADGTAVTAGSSTNYFTYYQTNGAVSTSAITTYAEGKGGVCMFAAVTDAGILNVDSAMGYITADGGEVVFQEGGEADGLVVSDNAKVSGLKNISIMSIEAGKTATMEDGLATGNVTFAATDGVKVTNTGEVEAITYSHEQTDAKVTADTMTVGGTEEVVVSNSLVVDEIINNNAGGLIVMGNVADDVTLRAAGGDILLAGQTSNTVSVVDLDIAPGNTVELIDGDQTEGTITVTDTLTGGSATLLANLKLVGGSTLDVDGGDTHALTLGSKLTIDLTSGGLVNLDDDTLLALNNLGDGETLNLIVALDPEFDALTYGEGYEGMSYDELFSRTGGQGVELLGNYTVYAQGDAFGLTKQGAVPEPTTGTLSLLALMALAARRRRK